MAGRFAWSEVSALTSSTAGRIATLGAAFSADVCAIRIRHWRAEIRHRVADALGALGALGLTIPTVRSPSPARPIAGYGAPLMEALGR